MLVKQDGKCGYCNAEFKNGDLMEAHHKTFVKEGGKDAYTNLVLMHKHCHDQYHAIWLRERIEKKRLKAMEMAKIRKQKALEKARRKHDRLVKGAHR